MSDPRRSDIEMVFGTPAPAPATAAPPTRLLVANERLRDPQPQPQPPVRANKQTDESAALLPRPPLAEAESVDEPPAPDPHRTTFAKGGSEIDGAVAVAVAEPDEGDGPAHLARDADDKEPWAGLNGAGGHDEPDMYYGGAEADGLHNRFGEPRPGSPAPTVVGSIPDVNTYQQKKNLAQGMMDLALLSANANQLRYVLESSSQHPYFYSSLTLIALSLALQVLVGVGLILNSRYNVKDEKDICKADKINNLTVLGIFLITIVNVFITSFSVATPLATTPALAASAPPRST